ncbi:hypothetical protein [Helicobacter rodentium]|uniref:hypothetical protein n=1 Tax=Helicobacter rodentium TaxID=59617 RepID=UPI0025AFE0D9|nr:hypothetical protein [Helicobacter rodentium]
MDRILSVLDMDCFYFISCKDKVANGIFGVVVRGLNYFLSFKSLQVLVETRSEIPIISFLGFLDNSPLSFSKVLFLNPFAFLVYLIPKGFLVFFLDKKREFIAKNY